MTGRIAIDAKKVAAMVELRRVCTHASPVTRVMFWKV